RLQPYDGSHYFRTLILRNPSHSSFEHLINPRARKYRRKEPHAGHEKVRCRFLTASQKILTSPIASSSARGLSCDRRFGIILVPSSSRNESFTLFSNGSSAIIFKILLLAGGRSSPT